MSKNLDDDYIVGTPGYIDPSILIGGGYGFKTDLYSIGCILFQMLSGLKPLSSVHGDRGSFAGDKQTKMSIKWQKTVTNMLKDRIKNCTNLTASVDSGLASTGVDGLSRMGTGLSLADTPTASIHHVGSGSSMSSVCFLDVKKCEIS